MMKNRLFFITLIGTLFITLVSTPNAATDLDGAWQALFANEIDKAEDAFNNAWEEDSNRSALLGLLLVEWSRGNYPVMADQLSNLIIHDSNNPLLSCYLAFSSYPRLQGWFPKQRLAAMQKGLKNTSTLANRQQMSFRMAETMNMVFDSDIEQISRNAGILIDHWNVVGPFGRYGSTDFDRSFGPETGWHEVYQGWQKEVRIHPIQEVDKTGLLEMDSLVYPNTGVAYALNTIEAKAKREALLTVYSPTDFRVWLNGIPILEKAGKNLDTSKSVSLTVTLKKGRNLLVIKSRQGGSPWIRTTLQTLNDEPLNIKSVPFDKNDLLNIPLAPFEAYQPMQREYRGIASYLPFNEKIESTSQSEKVINHILYAVWHMDRREYDAAKAEVHQAIELEPDYALLYELQGELNLRQANSRSGSKARFHREAETALKKALELYPNSRGSLIGLLTYYMDRDQTDQALELINDHLEAHPGIRQRGYQGTIDYAYAGLYVRKQFRVDSLIYYERSIEEFLPSLEVYRHLYEFHENNNNVREAVEYIVQALNEYPAFTAALNRGIQYPHKVMEKVDLKQLFKRAMNIHPHKLEYALLYGSLLENLGELDQAAQWYSKLHERFPEHSQPMERLASLAYLAGNTEKTKEMYKEMRERFPSATKAFRFFRDVEGERDFPYMKYDVQLEDVDITKADKWNDSRASVIYLLDIMVLNLHEDGTYDQYIHQAIKIMNQEGMKKWAEVVIPQGSNIELIKARTITPDETEWAVSHVQDLGGEQSLSMYGLEEGAIVEYAYLERTGRNDPGVNYTSGGYFFGSDDDPMLLSKLTIVRPENIPLNLDSNPEDFPVDITRDGERIVYDWENRMQDGLKPERFSPPLSERVPSLQWTTCPDWLIFAERQRSSLTGYEEKSQELDALAKELQDASESKSDYVQQVYNWIRENIEESGGGQTTADSVALKAGGRYQKIRLANQLLKKGEINTQLVLALENDENDGFRPMPYPTFPGHLLLKIPTQPGLDQPFFTDFASRFAPINRLDPAVKKFVGFVFDGPVPYFEPLEKDLWESGLLQREVRLALNLDGTAAVEGTFTYDVLYDQQVRELLANPEVRKRLADAQISRDLAGIQIQEYSMKDEENLSRPLRLVFSGNMPDVVKIVQASLDQNKSLDEAFQNKQIYKINPVLAPAEASSLVSEPTRAFPIEFKHSPVRDPLVLRYDVSSFLEKDALIQLPENTLLLNEYGYYSLFYGWDGSSIVVRRSFLIPPQTIQSENYKGFVEFCRLVDQAENREILIGLPSD